LTATTGLCVTLTGLTGRFKFIIINSNIPRGNLMMHKDRPRRAGKSNTQIHGGFTAGMITARIR